MRLLKLLALLLFVPSLAAAQMVNAPSNTGRFGPVVSGVDQNGNPGRWVVNGVALVDPASGLPIAPGAVAVTNTYTRVTQTTGGVSQTALNSNAARKLWCIQADSANATISKVNEGASASSTLGIELQPGAQVCNSPGFSPTAAIAVWNATTGATYNVVSGQ